MRRECAEDDMSRHKNVVLPVFFNTSKITQSLLVSASDLDGRR